MKINCYEYEYRPRSLLDKGVDVLLRRAHLFITHRWKVYGRKSFARLGADSDVRSPMVEHGELDYKTGLEPVSWWRSGAMTFSICI
jgi:hypothetical protein